MLSANGAVPGVLLTVPADGRPRVPPETLVAGLTVRRRIELAARRAGWETGAPAAATPERQRVVLVADNVVPDADWLRALRQLPFRPGRLYVDPAAALVVDAPPSDPALDGMARWRSFGEATAALTPKFASTPLPIPPAGRFVLTSPRDVQAAERWLLRRLIKTSEGFMSRHVERRLSLALTRRLCRTSITPNAMTIVSLTVGLLAAPFFLSSSPISQVAGALLFLAHSILDGCDGELARLKFLESRWGAVLDFWGDNLVHVAVFSMIAVGWSRELGAAWPLALGAFVVAITATAATIVYARTVRKPAAVAPESPLARVVDALSHRDFIYVIVALAAFGKAAWFLVVTAFGGPVFIIMLARARSQ
jgi:phosphatidylglycerophosphate synthase